MRDPVRCPKVVGFAIIDRVLALYDARFHNLTAKLTEVPPDSYIDVQNAASNVIPRILNHRILA